MEDSDLDTLLAKLAAAPRQRRPLHLVGTKRFELLRKLGTGAFGEVYEARDREHGTTVALKALMSSSPEWIYRFKREFRIVGDLAHPNLVRLFELFVEEDRWYLTMEMIQGLRFDEYLRRAPDQLRSAFGQLALGIAELHRARCLHRDLKPSNALIEATGRVVLLDFGLAVHQRASRTSALAGTPPYMAPELGLGHAPSEASDWYAFGVMLYEALAGELPFQGNSIEMLNAKLGAPPPPPTARRADADPVLAALAMRLIAKNPAERDSMHQVFSELLSEHHAPSHKRAGATPIVGRQAELATMHGALMSAAMGAIAVTVCGLPGMGKTALVATFLEQLRERRVQVYHGRCLELESVPFKGVDGAIDMLCHDLSRRSSDDVQRLTPRDIGALVQMFPMLKRVEAFARARPAEAVARSPQDTRRAAAQALRDLLGQLAAAAPVVIFVDDLQWVSEDTVRVLLDLLAPPAPRLVLITAYRRDATGSSPLVEQFLSGLAERKVSTLEVDVSPLDGAAIGDWLAHHPEVNLSSDQAIRETGGNPDLLSRLLRHGGHGGELDLATVLHGELAEIDEAARRILDLVAIAGGPIRRQALFEAADLPLDPATLDQLRRRKLIQTSNADAHIEAYHDRVREAAMAAISPENCRELHLRLATVLERAEVPEPETLARHYHAGGDVGRALLWTRSAAANASATLAFARAVELYQRAADLALSSAQRLDVLEQLAEAQVMLGRRSDAALTVLEAAALAADLGRSADHAALRARAGEYLLLAGQLDRGLELMRVALSSCGVTLPVSAPVAIAESFNLVGALSTRGLEFVTLALDGAPRDTYQRIDLQLAVARALTLSDLRGPVMAARGLTEALTLGEPRRIQRGCAFLVLNLAARMPGDSLVVAAEARAHELAEALGDELGLAWAELATGLHAIYRYEFATAIESLVEAERRFSTANGYSREATLARLAIVMVCGNYCVDIAYARRRHRGLTEEALARGDVFSANWSRFVQILLDLALGDPARARAQLAMVRATWPNAPDSLLSASTLLNELAIDLYEDPATAWRTVERIEPEYRLLFSSLMPFPVQVWARLASGSALGAFAAGHATRSETLHRIEAARDQISSLPPLGGHFAIAAHACLAAGDRPGAIAAYETAASSWKGTHQAVFEHSARLRMHQLTGDEAAAAAAVTRLRELGVGDPDRFANVFSGPVGTGPGFAARP